MFEFLYFSSYLLKKLHYHDENDLTVDCRVSCIRGLTHMDVDRSYFLSSSPDSKVQSNGYFKLAKMFLALKCSIIET